MNWNALKSYKCPKDNADLKDIGEYHACTKCVFSIDKRKFNEIVSSKYEKRPEKSDDDRLSEWNNYRRERRSEDFSDSPFL